MRPIHSGQPKAGPWLLQASSYIAYDIQSPAPGQPLQTKRGPTQPSKDPINDPMGHLNTRPYNYNTMVNNLVSHYHGANDNEKKQGRLWYRAAHDLFHNFAKDNNITPERAVAYGSAFSPLTDWGDNVHHAQKFMLGYRPGDPNFNEHDWQHAHIAQGPLDTFRQQNGRDPSESDEDLHQLADLHSGQWNPSQADVKNGLPGKHDIANNPEARQRWIENIQHKTMPAVLEDQARQADAWNKDPSKKGPYSPAYSMRASGINTLGGNIQKAKNLYHSPEDVAQMFKVLGGPKISHFTDNILDDTPINSEGYYEHPNGDWTQNKDLGGTIDSHHIRASSMPHGGWERKAYATKNPSTAHEYDVFNRGLLDATRHVNSQEPDPTKHITPKQLQAIVWLKHKNDKDYFERQRNPQTGQLINHESELGGVGRPSDWQFAEKSYKSRGKAAALDVNDFANMPPLWRKVFMGRQPQEWTDLLSSWVDHHSPGDPEPTQQLEQHEQERMGPHPQHEASCWYTADRVPTHMWYTATQGEVGDQDKYKKIPSGPTEASGVAGYGAGNSSWSGGTDPHAPAMSNATMPTSGGSMPSSMPGGSSSSGGGSSAPPVSYSPSSGVEQWRTQVDTGLQRNGLPTSLDNQVLHQMQTESSGNPHAENDWDSNAAKGTPSKGLLQTIDPTFQQYHLPGDANDPFDPQANIDSAIGYAKSTYGPGLTNSQGNGMGSGRGY